MPKYFCEYCGIFLTHSSPWGRKQHSHGRKHINNKIEYYSQFIYEFQQNKYQHLMEMATRSGPQINNMGPPRMMPPMTHIPPMHGMPPPMQSFPPGIQPMPSLNPILPAPLQNASQSLQQNPQPQANNQ